MKNLNDSKTKPVEIPADSLEQIAGEPAAFRRAFAARMPFLYPDGHSEIIDGGSDYMPWMRIENPIQQEKYP